MSRLLKSFALVAALIAGPAMLHADTMLPMTGQFSIQGTVTVTGTTLNFAPGSIASGFGTQTGTFATLLTNNELATAGTSTVAFSPYTAGSAFFTIGSLTTTVQTLNELDNIQMGQRVLGFTGTANFAAPGYLTTPGTFTFSTQESGPVTFSATAMTTSAVPEPSTLSLLGTGILGAAGMVSRKFRS